MGKIINLRLVVLTVSAVAAGAQLTVPLSRREPLSFSVTSTPHTDGLSASWSINLENMQNVRSTQFLYSGEVTLGTPPQTFLLQFDTGSSVPPTQWLWVASSTCGQCSATDYFTAAESSTYKYLGMQMQLYYGKGQCSGLLSTEVVGLESTDIQSYSQPFILVTEEQDFNSGFDGILVCAI